MIPFDVQTAPLTGRNLIEAAAGTGKTWSIEHLFVRLVLEQGCRVDEILVVTFTEAATDELRDRVHRRLLDSPATAARQGGLPTSRASNVRSPISIAPPSTPFTGSASGCCASTPSRPEARSRPSSSRITSALLREVAEDYWRGVIDRRGAGSRRVL